MKVLRFINDKLEEIFLVALLVFAVLLVTAQICSRVIGFALPWSEELARFSFLWLIWIGAAFATKEKKHIAIDIVVKKLPMIGQNICSMLVTIIWFGFLIFMVYESTVLLQTVINGNAKGMGSGMPMSVPYASVTVGLALMLLRLIQNLVIDVRNMIKAKKEVTE
jgi:TRAP-type C4-dicarboxylate transport system permease small subunit